MKKLFIGCGIVVLLLLGCVAFLVWSFGGEFRQLQEQAEASITRINAVAASHPFDPAAQASLDAERFQRALDVRAAVADDLIQLGEDTQELQRKKDAGEIGWWDMGHRIVQRATGVMPGFAARLEESQMSWPELAWYTRVMWSVLYRLDIGVGEPGLEPLRNSYTTFKEKYDALRREQKGLPDLRDLLGEIPPEVLVAAAQVMATDLQKVKQGLRVPEVEHLYMMPVTDAHELNYVDVPAETKERIGKTQPAPAEPQPAAPEPEPASPPK
jgi:hypothetical protein